VAALFASLVIAVAHGAPAAAPFGACKQCHPVEAAQMTATGGHGTPSVACRACHKARRFGRVGRRHRRIPSCLKHHGESAHPATLLHQPHPRGKTADCLACHDPHGSPNLRLIRPELRAAGNATVAVTFTSEAGQQPGSFADPTHPGTGICEVCHTATSHYRHDGRGAAHFVVQCTLCHDHTVGFRPVATDQACPICHTAEAAKFAKPSAHSASFAVCSACHAEIDPSPGAGHRGIPACTECHTDVVTHAPPGEASLACARCHDPHGSDNVKLVADAITTPQGTARPTHFTNLLGRVDGSFADPTTPGAGVCEICHTTTRFYRADGSGEVHFTFSCLPCHQHARGFNPPS
jgi:predicted CXXCH cytochrome family protein